MSKAFHKSFRKVLSVRTYNMTTGSLTMRCRDVVWCIVNSETSRTLKTTHIGFSTFIGNERGVEAYMDSKSVSLNKKNPIDSKFFQDNESLIKRRFEKSRGEAAKDYLISKYKNTQLEAKVSWFSYDTGYVKIESLDLLLPVYACNIKGAKTWYEQTACTFLKKDETVLVQLIDLGHMSVKVVGGSIHFDQAKWDSLDQAKLAFKCNENGKATSGLFE